MSDLFGILLVRIIVEISYILFLVNWSMTDSSEFYFLFIINIKFLESPYLFLFWDLMFVTVYVAPLYRKDSLKKQNLLGFEVPSVGHSAFLLSVFIVPDICDAIWLQVLIA